MKDAQAVGPPLGDATVPGEPQADLTRVLATESQDLNGTQTHITPTTYATGGAQAVPAVVEKAVDACGDGSTAKGSNGSTVHDAATAEDVAPAGEETVGFTATTSYRGVSHTVHAQAVRAGDADPVYFAADGMAMVNGRTGDAKLPPAAVKARSAKLGRARDNRLHSPAHRTRGALT